MANIEKEHALDILRARGLSPSRLGLRFDRVVVGVLADLRSFVEAATPGGPPVLVTISAPIRLPARTVNDLKAKIILLFADGIPKADCSAVLNGNKIRMRFLANAANAPMRFIGFVHNSGSAPEQLLDLAEQWLRAKMQRHFSGAMIAGLLWPFPDAVSAVILATTGVTVFGKPHGKADNGAGGRYQDLVALLVRASFWPT